MDVQNTLSEPISKRIVQGEYLEFTASFNPKMHGVLIDQTNDFM